MQTQPGIDGASGGDDLLTGQRAWLFALTWAAAALFHVAGNPRPPFVPASPWLTISALGLVAVAIAVILRPRRTPPLVLLCGLVAVTAWLEAPFVGNHWVLAAAISLAYLLAALLGRNRRHADDGRDRASVTWELFAPAARLTLLIAYGFAAFAKLNTGFFDPEVSCAVFYHDQLVRSWGLGALSSMGRPLLGTAVAVGAAAVELSVVPLLIARRTRRAGLLLALTFHWMLALDLSQHFWDFSGVLFAAFLLFLDRGQVAGIAARLDRWRGATARPSARALLIALAAVPTTVILLLTLAPTNVTVLVQARLLGHLCWLVLGTAVLVLVAAETRRTASVHAPGTLGMRSAAMLVIPALVVFNGLTPYLELKTGFGWNMYSNLRTVAGETNHLLVPGTLDLTGLQRDQIEVLTSSDSVLDRFGREEYALVYSEFREYARTIPDASITYRRNGDVRTLDRIGDHPAAGETVGVFGRRLQSFRAIDLSGRERCQTLFTPAR